MWKFLKRFNAFPRWVILMMDVATAVLCFALSYFIIKQFQFKDIYRGHFFVHIITYFVCTSLVFFVLKIHRGLIRYSNIKDVLRIFNAVLISSILYAVVLNFFVFHFFSVNSIDLGKVLFVNFFIISSLLVFVRAAIKELFLFAKVVEKTKKQVILIYGSDHNSVLIKNAFEGADNPFFVLGFIELNGNKKSGNIEQKKIYHTKQLALLKKKYNVEKLVLVNDQLVAADRQLLVDLCLKVGIGLIVVPPSEEWVDGRLTSNQIKTLKIEDLLQRDTIKLHNSKISQEIQGKRILVTGAAGSIGSELVRQIASFKPSKIILCDQAESSLHEINLEITEKYPHMHVELFICNIQNFKRAEILFNRFLPEIVFHAAAYKHVPMMELHPSEAVLTNVLGTKNIADLSVMYGVDKFVMISTDKAVRPTNVMGASKRIAEVYIQSLDAAFQTKKSLALSNGKAGNAGKHTKFVTTRFGNVLGSNGSVIPRFTAQIEKGGPVTVTDPRITRFFMTIPEAVELVLEAATMSEGGEVFVFDMGSPIKIVNLAIKMIQLAGFEPYRDIDIEYTGLRPGEKLYEELLNDEEKVHPTYHEKIKIAKVPAHDYISVLADIEELVSLTNVDNNFDIVRKMKCIVREFVSNNSEFECLDSPYSDEHTEEIFI